MVKNTFIICSSLGNSTGHTSYTDDSEHIRPAESTVSVGSSPVLSICPTLQDLLKKYDANLLGGSKENPFIIPGVCGVGEINKSVHGGFIYILLCEPNTLTWGKEDEWVV